MPEAESGQMSSRVLIDAGVFIGAHLATEAHHVSEHDGSQSAGLSLNCTTGVFGHGRIMRRFPLGCQMTNEIYRAAINRHCTSVTSSWSSQPTATSSPIFTFCCGSPSRLPTIRTFPASGSSTRTIR